MLPRELTGLQWLASKLFVLPVPVSTFKTENSTHLNIDCNLFPSLYLSKPLRCPRHLRPKMVPCHLILHKVSFGQRGTPLWEILEALGHLVSLAFLIDAGAQADADVALVNGKCVPHGSVFQEMISAIKARKSSDKAALFSDWLMIYFF